VPTAPTIDPPPETITPERQRELDHTVITVGGEPVGPPCTGPCIELTHEAALAQRLRRLHIRSIIIRNTGRAVSWDEARDSDQARACMIPGALVHT
jgi:hypothetical protein